MRLAMWLDMLDDMDAADLAAMTVLGSAVEREAILSELAHRLVECGGSHDDSAH